MTTKKEARERASYAFGMLMGICLAVDSKIAYKQLASLRVSLMKKIDKSDLSET